MFYPHTIKGQPFPRLDQIASAELPVSTANSNGSTQYFTVGSNPALDLDDGNKSHGMWFKTTDTGHKYLMAKTQEKPHNDYWDITLRYGSVSVRVIENDEANTRRYDTNNTYNDGAWHSLVVVWNGFGTFTIYVDGVSVAVTAVNSDAIAGPISNSELFSIGASATGTTAPMLGTYGFVGVWDSNLSASAAADFHNSGNSLCYTNLPPSLTSTLVEYWHLAEFVGHTSDKLTGQHSSLNATNIGSTPFTGSGLLIKCS